MSGRDPTMGAQLRPCLKDIAGRGMRGGEPGDDGWRYGGRMVGVTE